MHDDDHEWIVTILHTVVRLYLEDWLLECHRQEQQQRLHWQMVNYIVYDRQMDLQEFGCVDLSMVWFIKSQKHVGNFWHIHYGDGELLATLPLFFDQAFCFFPFDVQERLQDRKSTVVQILGNSQSQGKENQPCGKLCSQISIPKVHVQWNWPCLLLQWRKWRRVRCCIVECVYENAMSALKRMWEICEGVEEGMVRLGGRFYCDDSNVEKEGEKEKYASDVLQSSGMPCKIHTWHPYVQMRRVRLVQDMTVEQEVRCFLVCVIDCVNEWYFFFTVCSLTIWRKQTGMSIVFSSENLI